MGQLAKMIKQADGPTPEKALEAVGKLDDIGVGTAGKSIQNAIKWGLMLGAPTALIVAALKRYGFNKQEKRRRKLSREYMNINKQKRELLAPPSEVDVPVKTAMEKESADLTLPLILAGVLTGPTAYQWIKDNLGGLDLGGALGQLVQPTTNPLTHPLGASIILGTPMAAAGLSSYLMDKRLDTIRKERRERQREEAEREFEEALETEYSGAKVASFAGDVDDLADWYTSSKLAELVRNGLLKKANEIRKPFEAYDQAQKGKLTGFATGGLGLWLAAIMMLTAASTAGAWQWAKSKDPGRKRTKALEQLVKRRAMAQTPTFSLVPQPGEKESMNEEPI